MEEPLIRPVRPGDAGAIAAIYDHHARHGTASFDASGPGEEEFRRKIGDITVRNWPFLVAEIGGTVVGYAYATQFRDRPAYAFACENSIYVDPKHVGKGLGKRLLQRLIDQAETHGFRQMIAVIGGGEPSSIALHHALGFIEAGRMRSVGRKFGRWLDTVYMQRSLGLGDSTDPEASPSEKR